MIPPEVLLDRFLRSDKLTPSERAVYKGKQDLQALEPSLGSLLVDVQETLNLDLRQQQGNTFKMGLQRNFHFDYIDATCPNALAFEYEGYAFICLTMPLIRVLWRMCERLSRSSKVAGVLGVEAINSEQQEAILAVLFTTQFAFIVSHEFAHHDRGHFRLKDSNSELWEEVQADALGSLEQQAREIDADGWAAYLTLNHLMKGNRRDSAQALLGLKAASNDFIDEVFLSSFIIAVAAVLFVFPPGVFDERTLYQRQHPPQAARMNAIMHRIKIWCQQNRPVLESWLTLERYQCLMGAACEATSEVNWSKQEEFFHTQAGSEYFKRLHELVVALGSR